MKDQVGTNINLYA